MTTQADRPFWLGGGEDRDAAEACRYAPEHRWASFPVGEMLQHELLAELDIDPTEELTICRACYVPRCTALALRSTEDRCIRAMNHRERFHRYEQHPAEPVIQVPAHA